MPPTLIQDAEHELNFRQRGREARLARLALGGVPLEHAAMKRWLSDAQDARHEALGGVYHACTVRASNGIDWDLPKAGPFGCRIDRVPVKATRVNAGDPWFDGDDERVIEEGFWSVSFANVGPGFMAPGCDCESESAEEAEQKARNRLLNHCDCFRTRAEAIVAVEKMLQERARAR